MDFKIYNMSAYGCVFKNAFKKEALVVVRLLSY